MKRLALVTGGTRGIGEGICQALLDAGYQVATSYVSNDEKAAQFSKRTGIECFKFDVGDFEACGIAVAQIKEKYGDISVLVNNAGITRDSAFRNLSVEDWQKVVNTNLGGVFNMCRLVYPDMLNNKYGRIINISSVNGLSGQHGQANYTAAKSGMIGFTKTLAIEGAKYGVTANVLAPGYVETEMLRSIPDKVMEKILGKIPVGRLASIAEVARGVTFLASEDAGFITGSTLSINGGQFLQ
jgi:acetoacetyl-CoA reductase